VTYKVVFKTIGCKVNQYETGTLRQSFIRNGYQVVEFRDNADIYIINTCSVTGEAERKSKQIIRRAIRLNPRATIIVTGCAVQSNLSEIKKCKNISLIVGNNYKEEIFNIISQIQLAEEKQLIYISSPEKIISYTESKYDSSSNRIRGLVKIQDGCNQFCSYCIVPYLRGRARSRPINQIISEIKNLSKKGYKEVVLLGINLGSYGSDLNNTKINLINLISEIESIANIERIRLSSIELPYINKGLIDAFYYYPKLCHHLHIPLQSGDNRILSLMHRKYTSEQFSNTIDSIKKQIPDVAITTDVIVGFPGEDEEAFQNTISLVKKIGFSKVHVFPYSARRLNLSSFLPDKINEKVIKNRSRQLINLSKQITGDYIRKSLGKEKNVLIEFRGQVEKESFVYGLTDNYIKVYIYDENVEKGCLIKAKIIQVNDSYAVGKPL
jgi:threonylcarbamoyladenosine tRNA methylthiotransferase MtaB